VRGIIAVVGAQRGFTVEQQPSDGVVRVVARKKIRDHLTELPPRPAVDDVAELYSLACRSTTWQPSA
jgi:hypothetical protein